MTKEEKILSHRISSIKWAKKNKENKKTSDYAWRTKNPDKVKEIQKRCRDKRKEKTRDYNKEYYANNKEREKKRVGDYFQKNKKQYSDKLKERRHKNGISKKYTSGISYTKEYKKAKRIEYKTRFKKAGRLAAETVRIIYEDNIKKFGTLTCYLCLKTIPINEDTLDHIIPLSKGGTNEYNNLSVSCRSCNSKKGNKLIGDFLNP